MTQPLTASRKPPLTAPLLGLLMATSSIVFIEPAPYDLLLLGLLCLFFATGLRIPREIRIPVLLVGAFALSNVVAAAVAHQPMETIRSLGIRTYMVVAWIFFACVVASEPRRVFPALWMGYLVAAVIATVFGIAEYFGYIDSVQWEGGLRAKGPFKDPNVFGPFLVPAAIYCLSRLKTPGARGRIIYLPLFLLFAFGVLISFSRGAWLNLAATAGLYFIISFVLARSLRRRVGWLIAGGGGVLALLVMVTIALSYTTVADRFYERAVVTKSYDTAVGGRFYTQRLALRQAGATPLGIGPGRTDEQFGLEPHNLYLHVLVEGGWVAGLSWSLFVLYTLFCASRLLRWRSDLREDAVLVFCCLVGVLSQSAFIDSTHWRHLWLLLALAWGLIVTARRETPGATVVAGPVRGAS